MGALTSRCTVVYLCALLFLSSVLVGCAKEDDAPKPAQPAEPTQPAILMMNIKPTHNGHAVSLGDTVTSGESTYTFELTRLYFSYIKLVSTEGDTVPLADVALFDEDVAGIADAYPNLVGPFFSFQIPAGSYSTLITGVGLAPNLNGYADNNDFKLDTIPIRHPLSPIYGAYWDMPVGAGSYRFSMFEGKWTQSGSKGSFAYHTGHNSTYKVVNIPLALNASANQEAVVDLMLDTDVLLSDGDELLDFSKKNFTHGNQNNILQKELNMLISSNAAKALSAKQK